MAGKAASSPRVIVIGAGLGGVTMAVKLKKAGFTDFMVLEAEDGAGRHVVDQPLSRAPRST